MNKLTDKETEGTEKVNIQTERIKKISICKSYKYRKTRQKDSYRWTERYTDKQTYGQKNIYIDILTDKQAEIQTGSQMS